MTFFGDGHEPYAAVAEMEQLRELGLLDLDPNDRDVGAGLRVVHTPGHTPGHRSVILDAGEERVLIAGDLLHLPVQVRHPTWLSSHDEDPAAGADSRRRLLAEARSGGMGRRGAALRPPVRTDRRRRLAVRRSRRARGSRPLTHPNGLG